MKTYLHILSFLLLFVLLGCKSEVKNDTSALQAEGIEIPVTYASGFSIKDYGDYKILTVEEPWPNAAKGFQYLLYQASAEIPEGLEFDARVQIPVEKVVVTSTTHIASLELLSEEQSLVGFPGLDYVSSKRTRKLIDQGKVTELGKNEAINTEILLSLQPDVVIGFAVDGSNRTFNNIRRSGIPVIYNSDWTETSPLGKAEWIKFFGAFYNKSKEAALFFNRVENSYLRAKELAASAETSPTVLAGAMYKDQWFLPYGDSWHGRFFKDANAQYLYADTKGSGSLALSFEAVFTKTKDADFWIGPAQFQTYEEIRAASPHYSEFKAFQNRNIYTYSSKKGETGGVLFYEMAPNRPDLVLKDLISIFHPELLPDYHTAFYKPLK